MVLAPWAVVFWLARTPGANSPAAPAAKSIPVVAAPRSSSAFAELRPGPWGKIEFLEISIEPPEEFIPSEYVPQPIRWFFRGTTPADLDALWEKAQLSAGDRAALTDPRRRDVTAAGVVLEPEPELVLNLSADSRAVIYTALAAFPENGAQREPFRFRGDTLDDWFVGSGLPDEVLELTKKLIYRRNNTAFFSDYDLVLPRLDDPRLRVLYLKTLSRKTALMLSLRLGPDTDIEPVAAYWARGRRAKDVKPLLQSLALEASTNTLDVVHLIPRFARSLLYTFPLPSEDADAANRDCHWTSFNFYREEPDDRFTDIDFVKSTLVNDYYPVAGPAQLGDVLMFVQPGGVVVHSCVYIADDIVFTKNGPSYAVPWQFARLDTVVSFYSVGGQPIEIRRYRSKLQ